MRGFLANDVIRWGRTFPAGTEVEVLAVGAGGTAQDTLLTDDGIRLTVTTYEWEF